MASVALQVHTLVWGDPPAANPSGRRPDPQLEESAALLRKEPGVFGRVASYPRDHKASANAFAGRINDGSQSAFGRGYHALVRQFEEDNGGPRWGIYVQYEGEDIPITD